MEQGMMHGIEVVNSRSYYPEAHRWCLEKRLTMLSNSDIHSPLNLDYDVHAGDHRPLTLVFARDRSADAIREALFDRRTVAYSGNRLVGEPRFLRPIFERSIKIRNSRVRLVNRNRVYIQIHNRSDLTYSLERIESPEGIEVPGSLKLPAGRTALYEVRARAGAEVGVREVRIPYRVNNLLAAPNEGLKVELVFEADISRTK
jgi:hypothetical protein